MVKVQNWFMTQLLTLRMTRTWPPSGYFGTIQTNVDLLRKFMWNNSRVDMFSLDNNYCVLDTWISKTHQRQSERERERDTHTSHRHTKFKYLSSSSTMNCVCSDFFFIVSSLYIFCRRARRLSSTANIWLENGVPNNNNNNKTTNLWQRQLFANFHLMWNTLSNMYRVQN